MLLFIVDASATARGAEFMVSPASNELEMRPSRERTLFSSSRWLSPSYDSSSVAIPSRGGNCPFLPPYLGILKKHIIEQYGCVPLLRHFLDLILVLLMIKELLIHLLLRELSFFLFIKEPLCERLILTLYSIILSSSQANIQ